MTAKTPGQRVREALSEFLPKPKCAIHVGPVGATALLGLTGGGLLFWHLPTNYHQTHYPAPGECLDLNELCDMPDVSMIPEEMLFAHFFATSARRIN